MSLEYSLKNLNFQFYLHLAVEMLCLAEKRLNNLTLGCYIVLTNM
jgi:hypothetical protein